MVQGAKKWSKPVTRATDYAKHMGKATVMVKYEKVRRSESSVCHGNFLAVITKVKLWKLIILHTKNHILKRIFGVCVRTIGVYADKSYVAG